MTLLRLKSDSPGLVLQSFNFFRAGASNCGAVTVAGYYFHRALPCANKFRSFRAVSYCLLFLTHPIAIGSRISSDSLLLSSCFPLRASGFYLLSSTRTPALKGVPQHINDLTFLYLYFPEIILSSFPQNSSIHAPDSYRVTHFLRLRAPVFVLRSSVFRLRSSVFRLPSSQNIPFPGNFTR